MAAAMSDGIEIKFAQKLAGNEKEGRDRALKKLKKWINLKSDPGSEDSAFSELELLKLWKGLFYCMWMSDKPLVQEELAEELSQLVHLFPHGQDAVTFCSTFFTTMAREWHSIDAIRRDKFMMLVRRVLRQSLALAVSAGWSGPLTERLLAVYAVAFACPEDKARLPLGLQLHLVEICLEEVAKVAGGRLAPQQLAPFLRPFVEVLKVSRDRVLRTTVTNSIFYHLMRQSDVGIAHEAQISRAAAGLDSDDDEEEASEESDSAPDASAGGPLDPRAGGVDVMLPQLDVDYARLADDLVAAGAEPTVRQASRTALYRLAQQFRDLSEGEYPLALRLPDQVDSDSDISDEDIQAAVQRLQTTKARLNRDSRRNKRLLNGDGDNEDEPEPKKKKRRLKHQVLTNGVIDTGEALLAEAGAAETEEAPAAGAAPEPPRGGRLTLKERRRRKLMEKKQAELDKLERKRKKREKMAKLNGTASALENSHSMQNGEMGDGKHSQSKGRKTASGTGVDAVVQEGRFAPEEVRNSTNFSHVTKESDKQPSSKISNVQTGKGVFSLEQVTPGKKKASKTKSAEGDSPSPRAAANRSVAEVEAAPTPRQKKSKNKKSAAVNGEVVVDMETTPRGKKAKKLPPADSWVTNDIEKTPRQKKAQKQSLPESETTTDAEATPPSKRKKSKAKKGSPTSAASPEPGVGAGRGPSSATVATPGDQQSGSTLDWSLAAADDWGDAPVQDAAQAQFARFVASKPVPAFVKLRSSKGAAKGGQGQALPASPSTPGVKKVKINLSENKSQGFKEHLITVRNSPQVPHNPDRRPAKGLLKVATPGAATGAGDGGRARPGARRRSHAADFFNL
ncbi:ribosomal RNA processing protein 1 homolog A-like isoform X2 [Pollicipes pollicipes]|uniref:ribosomal RNA processing protein 1 homolog A-like isoform X2 n=1 Tax=Pollicipes pollicipes TaxID=41117 RepID=UPI001884A2C0|nr:ribosomal RNA processing protein 1 homolog A-like isoform X2 [Pollicipes pollicipes]